MRDWEVSGGNWSRLLMRCVGLWFEGSVYLMSTKSVGTYLPMASISLSSMTTRKKSFSLVVSRHR